MTDIEIIKNLENFDTPTVANVVATYPGKETCLSLFHPWDTNWYTDDTIRVQYPELGSKCGYAVTCTYGIPDGSFIGGPGIKDILLAIDESPKPAILLIKQDYPESMKHKNGLIGANMATAFKSAGCIGIITDGPSRDIDDVKSLGIQYMISGTSAAHGPMYVKSVNEPVSIAQMNVYPGEIIHMDINGAIKFPAKYLEVVLEKCIMLSQKKKRN